MRTLISLFIALFMISSVSVAYDYFGAGKRAYKNDDTQRANYYFKKAIEKSPNNVKCRYYYAQTFIDLKQTKKAQREYEKIIEIAPVSKAAKLASIGLSQLHRYYLISRGVTPEYIEINRKVAVSSVGDNYIENALNSGRVMRWSTGQMPIKVYIERAKNTPGYQDYYFTAVHSAISNWIKGAKDSNLNYKLVNTAENADIRVLFLDEILKQTGKMYMTGLATPYMQGDILQYFEVKLKTSKTNGKSYSQREMYLTALHEFGHALGIGGHSSDKGDIMYSSSQTELENEETGLSKRDLNTLTLLYTLVPDVSNFKNGKKPKFDKSKNDSVLGSMDQRLKKKLEEAIEYTKNYPKNVLSWMQLGKAYTDLEDYKKAVESYKKAMELDPTYIAPIEKLAFVYKEMGNNNAAVGTFRKLVKKEPSNIGYCANYARFLIENKKYSKASIVLENLFKVNPKARNNESISTLTSFLSKHNHR